MSHTIRSAFTVQKREKTKPSPSVRARRKPEALVGPSRAARMLALAHHVERLIDAGELPGYSEAARSLGLTRARLSQLINLMLLAPKIQERILLGFGLRTERSLRRAVSQSNWRNQLDDFARCEP